MKKITFIFQIFLLIPFWALAQIDYTAEFSLNNLSMAQSLAPDQSHYVAITLNDCFSSEEVGKPDLPIKYISFILPIGSKVNSITYSYNDTSTFILDNYIYPTQYPLKTCAGCPPEDYVPPDTSIYNSSNCWPSKLVTFSGQDYYDGNINILNIAVCPFEYYPENDSLIFVKSMDIQISLDSNYTHGISNVKRLIKYQNISENFLESFVANPDNISSYYIPPTYVTTITSTSILPSYEYVIITPSSYASAFDEFITWKRQKGLDIGIVTLEDIKSNYSGDVIFPNDPINDDVGKIRQYLYESYKDGTFWAFLIGDSTELPIRYGWNSNTSNSYDNIVPTDLYFSDFTGNWDQDNDQRYGEPEDTDTTVFYPEIFVGRLLCSSSQDIENWVRKLLIYEKHPGMGDSAYLKQSFMFQADQMQNGDQAGIVAGHLPMFDHTIWGEEPSYNDSVPTFPTGAQVIHEIDSNHYGLMSWFGHGGSGGQNSGVVTLSSKSNEFPQWKLDAEDIYEFHTETPEDNDALDNLTNYNYPFIIYSISCDVTPYDITKATPNNQGARNCGESFTVNDSAGGIAFLGNTRSGYVCCSYIIFNKFGDVLAQSTDNPIFAHIGYTESYSKSFFPGSRHLVYSHNLVGEPETQIWTDIPDTLIVSVNPPFSIVDQTNTFKVSVDNLDENKQATICFYKEDEVFSTLIVTGDENDHAEAAFDNIWPITIGNIIVTVTSYNYIPNETLITVEGCDFSETPIFIEVDETWDEDIYVNSDIIVESGNTLTVQSKISMVPDAKIIVQQGAILDIDNGIISSACDGYLWQGIQVWGTANASQSTSGAQGKLTIINGGTIENAIAAVRLARSDGERIAPGYEGGIIQTDDAHFINNRTGVRFYPYRNMVSGVEMDNLSYFQKAEFLTDAELADESNPEEFLYLDCVKGINVKGCSFTNSRPEEEASMSDRGIGIYSFDASFTVSCYCGSSYPCENPISSTFTNLNYGIQAFDVYSTRTFEVNQSGFYNNLTGIYLKFINYADIIFNDFELYNVSLFHGPNDIFGGVYLDFCTGYIVEENNFYNDDEYDPQNEIRSIGITVNNSGNNFNMLYRNTFDRLHMGILAQNGNRGTSIGTGLKFKCNICTNNQGDFAVTAATSSSSMGISIYQGTNTGLGKTAPAGNLFTLANNNDPYSDFNNTLSRQNIYYYHHPGSSQDLWVPRYYQNITPASYGNYQFDYDSVCPSNFSLVGGLKNSTYEVLDEEALRSRMIMMENLRDSAANELSLWIDAGNTPELNYEVESSTPNESLDIYDELMADSPYLSETVLASSIEKEDVLVNAMIRDIMVANPHGVKKEELIEALEQRVPPVPEYMMAEIMAGLDSIAQKEQRESEIAWYAQERDLAYNKLMKIYLDGETFTSAEDSLTSLILNHGNLNSQYFLATRYLDHGDISNAFSLLSEIPNQFEMDSEQLSENQDYITIISIISNITQQGLPLDSLDNTSRQVLYQIAENDSRPAAMAQNILQYIDTVNYPEVYILPTSGPVLRKYEAENPEVISGPDEGNIFRVFPNPSNDYFILEYYFEVVPRNASYSINDPLGRIIEEGLIEGQQNQLIRRTTNYSSGIYTIKLIINGKVKQALKLNVIK